jgi:hypothetical protein
LTLVAAVGLTDLSSIAESSPAQATQLATAKVPVSGSSSVDNSVSQNTNKTLPTGSTSKNSSNTVSNQTQLKAGPGAGGPKGSASESLVAYNNSASSAPPVYGAGQSGTLYYEDETPYSGSTSTVTSSQSCSGTAGPSSNTVTAPSLVISGGAGSYTSNVSLNNSTLYAASTCQPGTNEAKFLKTLSAVNPSNAGSLPNASDNNLSGGPAGEGGNITPYVSQFNFTMPSGLTPGTYTATFKIEDGDNNPDQYSWTFTIPEPLSCSSSTIYNLGNSGTVYALDTSSASNTPVASFPSSALPGSNYVFNGLGMSSSTLYSVAQAPTSGSSTSPNTNVVVYNTQTGSVSTYLVPAGNNQNDLVAGGVDPANGNYYYGEYNTAGTSIRLYEFNTSNNSGSPVGEISLAGLGLGVSKGVTFGNGDLAFDAHGNMYFLAGSNKNSSGAYPASGIITVPATEIYSASATGSGSTTLSASLLSTLNSGSAAEFVGMAFESTGVLYAETFDGALYSVNVDSGQVTSIVAETGTNGNGIVDLASCQYPGSVTVEKNLPNGRLNASDQFTVSVSALSSTGS